MGLCARSSSLSLVLAVTLAACNGGGGGTSSLTPVSSSLSYAGNLPIHVSGGRAAYLADEATTGAGGTDLNGDGDRVDRIAVVMDVASGTENVLDVAADELAWAGSVLFLVVDEASDGRNWETVDGGMNLVLLSFAGGAGLPTYVDTLADAGLAVTSTRVFYASATATPAMAGETTIRVVDAAVSATATTDVMSAEALALSPRVLGQEQGLVFLALDETVEGADLNADADTTDGSVLALLDGTSVAHTIRSTGLALADDDALVRARVRGVNDWLVGFLVSEGAQNENLNDPMLFSANWQPTQCTGPDDADMTDQVLHALEFAAWDADSMTDPVVNTGLVATLGLTTGQQRLVLVGEFLALVSSEADEGCDLNSDGDSTDLVVRIVEFQPDPLPILPVTDAGNIRALNALPGGTRGLAVLGSRLIIALDEAADSTEVNGDAIDEVLLGWIDPASTGPGFTFAHPGFVEASWMAEQANGAVLPIALSERLNVAQGGLSNQDGDTTDSFPAYAVFNLSQSDLNFPGIAVAVDADQAGTVLAKNQLFYRCDEAADERDRNGDGDMTDIVLLRTSTANSFTAVVDVLAPLPNRFAVDVDFSDVQGAFYVASESGAGRDYNGDGDTTDNVLRLFRY